MVISTTDFKYGKCLMKHYVRTKAWLPLCRERKKRISEDKKNPRKLRYLTFCAEGAIDVLMLDCAKVIKNSTSIPFDNVTFFDRDDTRVDRTKRNIPGAEGFGFDFAELILSGDPLAANQLEAYQDEDNKEARRKYRLAEARAGLYSRFPFDVINLDLEEHLFKPSDPLPGELFNSFRKIFQWQKNSFNVGTKQHQIDGFSLMLTTRVGPENMSEDYIEMLVHYLRENVNADESLGDILEGVTGERDVVNLKNSDFDAFFKLGTPKALASLLLECDWEIEPDRGIMVFEFDRSFDEGAYTLLHMVMQVKRCDPSEDKRIPNTLRDQASYREVVRKLFRAPTIPLEAEKIRVDLLKPTLDEIDGRRKLYASP
jgi:hypothetical protein